MDKLLNALQASEPLFLLALGILIAEAVAWFALPHWYFSQGLPIFRGEAGIRMPSKDVGPWLHGIQPESFWGQLHFKAFDARAVGVRESLDLRQLLRLNYTPVMRAMLLIDQARGTVTLTGYANYSFLLLVPLTLLHSLQNAARPLYAIPAVLIIVGVTGGLYLIQQHRYQQLLAALTEQGRAGKTVSAL